MCIPQAKAFGKLDPQFPWALSCRNRGSLPTELNLTLCQSTVVGQRGPVIQAGCGQILISRIKGQFLENKGSHGVVGLGYPAPGFLLHSDGPKGFSFALCSCDTRRGRQQLGEGMSSTTTRCLDLNSPTTQKQYSPIYSQL